MTRKKVIGCGLPKTGTTSLGDACEKFGMSRLRWNPDIHGPLTFECYSGDYNRMRHLLEIYDVLEDMPFCFHYHKIYELVDDAFFVLTVRRNSDVWLDSIKAHLNRIEKWDGVKLHFGSHRVEGNEERFLEKYDQHIQKFISFFHDKKKKHLILNVEDKDNMMKLADFLGEDIPSDLLFPHSNARKMV